MDKFNKIEKAVDLLLDCVELKNIGSWEINSKLHYAIQWLVSAMLDKSENNNNHE